MDRPSDSNSHNPVMVPLQRLGEGAESADSFVQYHSMDAQDPRQSEPTGPTQRATRMRPSTSPLLTPASQKAENVGLDSSTWRTPTMNNPPSTNIFKYSADYQTLVNEHAKKTLLLDFDDDRRLMNVGICVNAVIGIILMVIENIVAWDGNKVVSNTETQALKCLISASTFILLLQIARYNHLKAKMQIARYFSGPLRNASFIYQDRIIPFLIEFTVCAWHIPPFIDYALSENPDKWGTFMFFRLYLLIRPMRDFSPVYINRGRIIKSGHSKGGEGFNTWLIHLRINFYERPGIFVLTIFFCIYAFLSFSIYVHERDHQDFTFGLSLWYTAITMTTVGYGDTVAVTTMGRILAVAGGMLGIILSSFCVAVTTGFLRLSHHQKFAIDWVNKARMDHSEEEAAALLVQSWWRLSRYRRAGNITPKIEYKLVKNIIRSSLQLRRFRRMHRFLESYADDPVVVHKLQLEGRFDPVLDRILRVEDTVNKLDWRLKRLYSHIASDDTDPANAYRTLYSRKSSVSQDRRDHGSRMSNLSALTQRINRMEETQTQILAILKDLQKQKAA